jgi:hypothetical protein
MLEDPTVYPHPVSTADGRTFDVPPSAILHPDVKHMDIGGTSVNTNYKMSIHGNAARASHDDESTAKDGNKSYSYELRMPEKTSGEWKVVAKSIHLYKNKWATAVLWSLILFAFAKTPSC